MLQRRQARLHAGSLNKPTERFLHDKPNVVIPKRSEGSAFHDLTALTIAKEFAGTKRLSSGQGFSRATQHVKKTRL
jgi:hypothetical protein